MVKPNITTMRQPVYEVGRILATRMLDILNSGEYVGAELFIEPVLEVNGTTK